MWRSYFSSLWRFQLPENTHLWLVFKCFRIKLYKMWWHLTVWYASNCMTNGIVFIHAICTCLFSWSFAHWNSKSIELRQVELTWIDSIKAQWMRNLHAGFYQLVRFFVLAFRFWSIFLTVMQYLNNFLPRFVD